MEYPDFYLMPDGTEVVYEELVCPFCGTKADDMYDEADTQLICKCDEHFLHVIWDLEGLMKRHPDIYRKNGIEPGRDILVECYEYPSLTDTPSFCRMEIYGLHSETPVVVLTDLVDNLGTSVTNQIEALVQQVYKDYIGWHDIATLEQVRFIEHRLAHEGRIETFDEVSYIGKLDRFTPLQWKQLEKPDWIYT